MRAVTVGVLGLGAILISFAVVFFLWGPATATSVPMPKTASVPAPATSARPSQALAPLLAMAETTGSIGSAASPPARAPLPVAAAPSCQGRPEALGVSRPV